MQPKFDEKDGKILKLRAVAYDRGDPVGLPHVGDWIRFPDGTHKRVAHVWGEEYTDGEAIIQPTWPGAEGSFYLGDDYVSHSGGLESGIPLSRFALTDDRRDGDFWFFHHDWHTAHNGVHFTLPCRVWSCSLPVTTE